MKEFNIKLPKWAGTANIIGEFVLPTIKDFIKEANKVYKSMEQN